MSNKDFDENALFASLVESAFEFLDKSLSEFPTFVKFSTVHFAISIELFIKARLMKEHWSLLVEKTDTANRDDFFKGKSRTVNPETAIMRLKNIACDPIPEEARKIFQGIAQHRNRMVHFIHNPSSDSDEAKTELEKVVVEQCNGWRQLQVLFEKNWAEHFAQYQDEISAIEYKMQSHRAYLVAKFETKKEEIDQHIASDGVVKNCHSCGFNSSLVKHVDGAISLESCVVCYHSATLITLECPAQGCANSIEFDSYDGPPEKCSGCSKPLADWVAEALNTGETVNKDNYFDHIPMNCPYCGGYHTVVEHSDGYVCTVCYEYSPSMETCGWCNEGQLGGVSEFSFLTGCSFCDGRAGFDKD